MGHLILSPLTRADYVNAHDSVRAISGIQITVPDIMETLDRVRTCIRETRNVIFLVVRWSPLYQLNAVTVCVHPRVIVVEFEVVQPTRIATICYTTGEILSYCCVLFHKFTSYFRTGRRVSDSHVLRYPWQFRMEFRT